MQSVSVYVCAVVDRVSYLNNSLKHAAELFCQRRRILCVSMLEKHNRNRKLAEMYKTIKYF